MATVELIKNLQNPKLYSHPVSNFNVLETHISWVILTGDIAYKIKKPLNLGFLDFSSLEKRQYYCQLELKLNQTLAAEIYQEVIRITGDEKNPEINGNGPIIEYALKMREFPQKALFDHVLARNELTPLLIDELAQIMARFHRQATIAPPDSHFGTPEQLYAPVTQNFEQMRSLLQAAEALSQLDKLQAWATKEYARLKPIFATRKQQGFIRECHGDIHLGNIILFKGHPLLFDCIEFNEDFRWTDVMADVGFLAMDLEDHQRPDYARRLINSYFEQTGDYPALQILPFYIAYRAMVRAKISLFRLHQPDITPEEQKAVREKYLSCTTLAERYTQRPKPFLFITHGVAGSGKSTLAKLIVQQYGAIQIRADVERKRLFGLEPLSNSRSPLNQHIYSEAATKKTYQRLAELAQTSIDAGYPVVTDATFLKHGQRTLFRKLAKQLQIPFAILSCQPSEMANIPAWINQRVKYATDPSEATLEVLAMQYATQEPLTPEEQQHTLRINTDQPYDKSQVLQQLAGIVAT